MVICRQNKKRTNTFYIQMVVSVNSNLVSVMMGIKGQETIYTIVKLQQQQKINHVKFS